MNSYMIGLEIDPRGRVDCEVPFEIGGLVVALGDNGSVSYDIVPKDAAYNEVSVIVNKDAPTKRDVQVLYALSQTVLEMLYVVSEGTQLDFVNLNQLVSDVLPDYTPLVNSDNIDKH